MLVKNMGRAQVDSGYYETMYERLLKASQAREGIVEEFDKFAQANEDYAMKKLIKENQRQSSTPQSSGRLTKSARAGMSRNMLLMRPRTKPEEQVNGFTVLS